MLKDHEIISEYYETIALDGDSAFLYDCSFPIEWDREILLRIVKTFGMEQSEDWDGAQRFFITKYPKAHITFTEYFENKDNVMNLVRTYLMIMENGDA